MEHTTPLIFYRSDQPGSIAECGRRELTRQQTIAFHSERKKDQQTFDLELLEDFNRSQNEHERASGFSLGSLNVHVIKS